MKRLISVTLVLALVLLMCMPALSMKAEAATVSSGTCGDNLTWTLDDTGTLTISGTGSMTNYGYYGSVPWYSRRTEIKKLVISSGVTSVSRYAFYNCTALNVIDFNATAMEDLSHDSYAFYCAGKSDSGIVVNVGANVTRIPNCLFYADSSYAPNIKEVTFAQNSVCKSIGDSAFGYCGKLSSIAIPEGVSSIEDRAFYYCSSLTSITIPKSVTSIGNCAFSGCKKLNSISADKDNASYCSDVYGVLFNKSKTTLIQAPGKLAGSYAIPEGVTSVGVYAFYDCTGLTGVTIPDGVTSIGFFAFSNCTGLTSVTISDSVTSIGGDAFYNCTRLTDVYFGGVQAAWEAIAIDEGNERLTNATIHMRTAIASGTCGDNLTWILDNTGTLKISGSGNMQAYSNSSTSTYPPWYYNHRSVIKKVVIGNGVTRISSYAFVGCSLESVTIPDSVTRIDEGAFYYCSSLKSITIPDSVTVVYRLAFSGCSSLTSITIPDSVTGLGASAFQGCSSLTDVYVADLKAWCNINFTQNSSNPLNYAENFYVNNELITDLVIPDSITGIRNCAFSGYGSLTSVTIPSSVTNIGNSAFYNCSSLTDVYYNGTQAQWDAITIGTNNEPLTTAKIHLPVVIVDSGTCGDNLTWTLDDAGTLTISGTGAMTDFASQIKTPWYAHLRTIKHVVIEPGVTTIGEYAFADCILERIAIPEGVTKISNHAFAYGSLPNGILLPDSLEEIGSAFFSCYVPTIKIPKGVTYIDSLVFFDSSGFGGFEVDEENTVYASDGSGLLLNKEKNVVILAPCGKGKVTIPEGITHINSGAFFCSYLTEIKFPVSVQSIGSSAFASCNNLTDVCYNGTLAQWNAITVAGGNGSLTNAKLHYGIPASQENLQQLLDNAESGTTVCLTQDVTLAVVSVWDGVTLNLNGYTLTTNYFTCYGTVADGTDGGDGLIVVNKRIHIASENDFLPIYDTAAGGYRFYDYELENLGFKAVDSTTAKIGFRLTFSNPDGYTVLANTTDNAIEAITYLSWTGSVGTYQYRFSDNTIRTFATKAAADIASKGTTAKAVMLTLKGVNNFKNIEFCPTVETEPGVIATGSTITWSPN